MIDFLLRKLLPFALARSMSVVAVPLFQFILIAFCSREEAGRFYLLASLALMASQLADLGVSRAMPVIYADSDDQMHDCLAEINLLRWFSGLLLGSLFLLFGQFGQVAWNWHPTGSVLLLLCFGRTILLGHQGYSHARQQFSKLLLGSSVHFLVVLILSASFAIAGRFDASAALICLTAGVWVEIFMLDRPSARTFLKSGYKWAEAVRYILPFSKVGVYTAAYNRIESLSAGYLLDAESLGIFGTLDSALRMASWPLYVGAQAIFPGIRDAVKNRDAAGLSEQSRRYLIVSFILCAVLVVFCAVAWYFYRPFDWSVQLSVMLLLPALFLSAPYAFLISLYYSLHLERLYARFAFLFMVLRCSLAPTLALLWGYVGLSGVHLIVGTVAVAVLWSACLPKLREMLAAESVDG